MRKSLTHKFWVLLAIFTVLALGASGCTEDLLDDEAADGSASSTTSETLSGETTSTDVMISTTTSTPAASTTTVSVASSEELLPNGNIKACGLITDVWMDGSVRKLKIDYIDYFSGAEADAAALADGFIQPGEQAPNGWYMRNNNPMLRTYTVSNTVEIATSSRDYDEAAWDPPCSWSDFMSFWGPPSALSPPEQQIHGSKWWIERQGDTVVVIEELWTP